MIRPKEMKKISLVGPKTQLQPVVSRLHELGVLHIDDYSTEAGKLDIGDPQEDADELSETLVKLRSIRAKLPAVESIDRKENGNVTEHLEQLQTSIDDIHNDLDEVREQTEELEQLLETLRVVERLDLETSDITDYASLDMYVGTVSNYTFTESLPDDRHELFHDNDLIALFVDADVDVDGALRESNFDSIDMDPVKDIDEPVTKEIHRVEEELQALEHREEEFEAELREIAEEWRGYLDTKEHEMMEELEKAEAPLRFAVTGSTFNAEGWVPADRFDEISEEIDAVADGRIHIEEIESDPHETPVEHDNPNGVDNFQDLVGFFGTPSYTEIDPTFLLLTFPLLFGFMLGDIGYGLTTFAVFYLFYRKFPAAEGLWKSLMYASAVTIVFGFMYAEMFGFTLFGNPHGHSNILTQITGIGFFEQIPIIFHRPDRLASVLSISLIIGVLHVNFGYLIGAYNEYIEHGLLEAVFAKLSWIVLEIGAVLLALQGLTFSMGGQTLDLNFIALTIPRIVLTVPNSPLLGGFLLVGGVTMLFKGEGIEGVVEIPSLLSNILSYLRIFGVSIAIVALAAVVNQMAQPLFQSGNVLMIGFGILILVIGHTMNTFLKMMEAGLQGIRLHYVEFFTKFFEGGGRYYSPFGAHHIKKS